MKATKNPSSQHHQPLDKAKVKLIRRALRDAAEALGTTKLLAHHPWDAALDVSAEHAEHSRDALGSALNLTEQLIVRARDFEKLDAESRKALLKSLKAHKKADAKELAAIAENVMKHARPVIEQTEEEIRRFGQRFAQQLADELQSADVSDIKRYLEGYIHARFEETLRLQTEQAGARIEGIVEEAQTLIQDNWNRHAEQALGPVATKLDLRIDSFRFDVGVMALSAVGLSLMFTNFALGGLLTLAAPAAAFAIKGKLDKQSRARAVNEVPRQIIAASDRLANELGTRLLASVAALSSRVEQYGTLWPAALLETLRHADGADIKLDDAEAAIKRARTALNA